jgi:hypothetical protein
MDFCCQISSGNSCPSLTCIVIVLLGKGITSHCVPDILAELIGSGIVVGEVEVKDQQSRDKAQAEKGEQGL